MKNYNGIVENLSEAESALKDAIEKVEELDVLKKTSADICVEIEDIVVWMSDVVKSESHALSDFGREFELMRDNLKEQLDALLELYEVLRENL